jgi:hypothetical protein
MRTTILPAGSHGLFSHYIDADGEQPLMACSEMQAAWSAEGNQIKLFTLVSMSSKALIAGDLILLLVRLEYRGDCYRKLRRVPSLSEWAGDGREMILGNTATANNGDSNFSFLNYLCHC